MVSRGGSIDVGLGDSRLSSALNPCATNASRPNAHLLLGLKTPPYAKRQYLVPGRTIPEGGERHSIIGHHAPSESEIAALGAAARKNARQVLDASGGNVEAAADEFAAAEARIRPHKQLVIARASPDQFSLPVHEQFLSKLEYLHDCREMMGESRFARERQRLELQARVKNASKYAINKNPRWLHSGRNVSPLGKSRATDEDGDGSRTPPTDVHSPDWVAGPDATTATFQYEHQCTLNAVATPCLGSFALAAASGGQSGSGDTSETAPALRLCHWSMGDGPLLALVASPLGGALANIEHCHLRGNRLSTNAIEAFLASVGHGSEILDLAENRFDRRGAEIVADFLHRGATHLKELDLSGNRLDDQSVARICHELAENCPELEQLGIADVQMGLGALTGPELGALVEGAPYLTALDVSYNMLQGNGALKLLAGIRSNGLGGGGRLRHLELGWNCLGTGPQRDSVVRLLASIFKECDILFHLGLSFNQLGSEDCTILAQGLQDNHTLWGLHMDGNSAVLDSDGFICPFTDGDLQTSEEPRAKGKVVTLGTGKKSKKKDKKGPVKDEKQIAAAVAATKEARIKSLEWNTEMYHMCEDWQVEQAASESKQRRRDFARTQTSLLSKGCTGTELLPDQLRKHPSGQPLPPRVQQEWLHALSLGVRPELRAMLLAAKKGTASGNGRLVGRRGSAIHSSENIRGSLDGLEDQPHTPSAGSTAPAASDAPGTGEVACSCWICEAWIEVDFCIRPGVSIARDLASEGLNHIYAFLSLDNFHRPVLLERRRDGSELCWEGSRFLPPTGLPIFVVFQIGPNLQVAADLPRRRMQHPLELPLSWGVEPIVIASSLAGENEADTAEVHVEDREQVMMRCSEVNLLYVASVAEERLHGSPSRSSRRLSAVQPGRRMSAQQLTRRSSAGDIAPELLHSCAPPRSVPKCSWSAVTSE